MNKAKKGIYVIQKKELSGMIRAIRSELEMKQPDYSKAVRHLLIECNILGGPQIIPLIDIAEQLGFKVYSTFFKNDDIAGLMCDAVTPVKPFNEQRVIIINKNNDVTHKRFTIAHELGHFMLHCKKEKEFFERFLKSSTGCSQFEKEANDFAVELLMPTTFVVQVLQNTAELSTSDKVHVLTNTFAVSEELAKIKYASIAPLIA